MSLGVFIKLLLRVSTLCILFCVTKVHSMANLNETANVTPPALSNSMPPLRYDLASSSITIINHGATRVAALPARIDLRGSGVSTLENDGSAVNFNYSTKDFIILLNSLYKIRFFHLPSNYTTRYSVFLNNDNIIETSALRMHDQATTTVCFNTSQYKKCVTYGDDQPKELHLLTKALITEVVRLSKWPS